MSKPQPQSDLRKAKRRVSFEGDVITNLPTINVMDTNPMVITASGIRFPPLTLEKASYESADILVRTREKFSNGRAIAKRLAKANAGI